MAKIPDSTKTSLHQRLTARARERWPQLTEIRLRYRAGFAYVDGVLADGEASGCAGCATAARPAVGLRDLPSQPRRLRRLLPAHRIHGGTAEDALDTACGLYLGDPTAWT